MIDAALAGRLIARQFPQWAHLPMTPVPSAGTDNAIFRLGDALCMRLPKVAWAADSVARECEFLPRFRGMPLQTPIPVARGEPDGDYANVWSVCEWIEGDAHGFAVLRDPAAAARALSAFVLAMRQVETKGGPVSHPSNNLRGGPLRGRDARTRQAIQNLAADIDAKAATGLWEQAQATPEYSGPGVWIHSDIKDGNLLMRDGRLTAVIDFGMLAVGDPALDVTPAWSFFDGKSREQFLNALSPDEPTLARAKGWAVSIAAIAWDYYRDKNHKLAAISRATLAALSR